jgi:uncharacterized protein YukE
MDPAAVEDVAARLAAQAELVSGVVSVIDGAVAALGQVWHGDDVAMFANVWHSAHRPNAQAVASELAGWASQLKGQVSAQEAASGGSSAGGVAGLVHGVAEGAGLSALAAVGLSGVRFVDGIMGNDEVRWLTGAEGVVESFERASLWDAVGRDMSKDAFEAFADGKLIPSDTLKMAGKTLGFVGVGVGAFDTFEDFKDGHAWRGVFDGAATGLGVAALVTPPPVDIVCGGASAVIGIGELAYDHRQDIEKVTGALDDGARDLASSAAGEVSSVWHHLI